MFLKLLLQNIWISFGLLAQFMLQSEQELNNGASEKLKHQFE